MALLVLLYFNFIEAGSRYEAQEDLKLAIILPKLAKCWDYRYASSHPTTLVEKF
jgi:hypothetical protein